MSGVRTIGICTRGGDWHVRRYRDAGHHK